MYRRSYAEPQLLAIPIPISIPDTYTPYCLPPHCTQSQLRTEPPPCPHRSIPLPSPVRTPSGPSAAPSPFLILWDISPSSPPSSPLLSSPLLSSPIPSHPSHPHSQGSLPRNDTSVHPPQIINPHITAQHKVQIPIPDILTLVAREGAPRGCVPSQRIRHDGSRAVLVSSPLRPWGSERKRNRSKNAPRKRQTGKREVVEEGVFPEKGGRVEHVSRYTLGGGGGGGGIFSSEGRDGGGNGAVVDVPRNTAFIERENLRNGQS
jgi:hypothetical protein